MAVSEFLIYATDPAALVETQSQYNADSARPVGAQVGIADPKLNNKALRQATFVAAAVMKHVADLLGTDSLDDGDLTTAVARIASAFGAGFSTGDVKYTSKTTADPGWIVMDDGTIGDATSGATTRANADTAALFTLLWDNYSDANCPVSGGRGGSAAADFAAHKTIQLPLAAGRALGVSGSGAGLTARSPGDSVGEETHVLTTGELPNAVLTGPGSGGAGALQAGTTVVVNSGGGAHNNMQPTTFVQLHIKL